MPETFPEGEGKVGGGGRASGAPPCHTCSPARAPTSPAARATRAAAARLQPPPRVTEHPLCGCWALCSPPGLRLGGGPGPGPCPPAPAPEPRCRMPEVKQGEALACGWGDAWGVGASVLWQGGWRQGTPVASSLGSGPAPACAPHRWALCGWGWLQLALECESKHSPLPPAQWRPLGEKTNVSLTLGGGRW